MFSDAIEELKKMFFIVDIVHIFANSFIALLGSIFFLVLFRFDWIWAFIPFTASLLYFGYVDLTKNKMLVVEENVPELGERLRTAVDNADKQNWMIDGLKDSVLFFLGKAKSSYFLDFKRLSIKVFSIFILGFLVVLVSYLNINFDFVGFAENIIPLPKTAEWAQGLADKEFVYDSGNINKVTGEPSLARLSNEELKLSVGELKTEVDIRDIQAIEDKDFTRAEFPKEIYTAYEEAYVEQISKEDQSIVKNYFSKLNI